MKIVVCIRQSASGEINPFDASAYELALRVGGEVTILSMGPEKCYDFLLELTRLGGKRAILLTDPAFAGADTLATSYALSCAMKRLCPDLIICGRQTIDGDTGQVGPELAYLFGAKLITEVMDIRSDGDELYAIRRQGDREPITSPTLITAEKSFNLRLPSIRSKVGEVVKLSAADICADLERCGLRGSPTRVVCSFENQSDRRKCKFISRGELASVIKDAAAKEKAPVKAAPSAEKMPLAYIVGEAPLAMALSVAKDVKVLNIDTPEVLADIITKEKPQCVLWGTDSKSRRTAATVAAMLRLGLCADCTSLEYDSGTLYMYRPAFSGNIIAKIRSTTTPAMATVRCAADTSSRLAIGIGLGATSSLEEIRAISDELGAELVGSRLAVDRDFLPYSSQVGLTGKNISPDVYIALGISGAVHHIAGIRTAGTVIAVNSDKDAKIFDYADYGVVCRVEDVIPYLK